MENREANIDGLVGPTHHYAGLSYGNIASELNARTVSSPKQAALQGLEKMWFLHNLGIPQLVMPPHPRPARAWLKQIGFESVASAPQALLHVAYSASGMWVANAATVSASADTEDGKLHFTPANLVSKLHRSLEPAQSGFYLKQMFKGDAFVHHDPLPAHVQFSDEGAANHMRLFSEDGERGLEIFVYGGASKKYPARQSREACEAIARLHQLDSAHVMFLEQSAAAIDAGVFHNDVIAMSNAHLLIHHEQAFTALPSLEKHGVTVVCIPAEALTLEEAVSTYFFNSQLVTLPKGEMVVIAPAECEEHPRASACFNRLIEDGHIDAVHYLNVRESMKNGGGPACLRLRIPMTSWEMEQAHPNVILSEMLYTSLSQWIKLHYRDTLSTEDLQDPLLEGENEDAFVQLEKILNMTLLQDGARQ